MRNKFIPIGRKSRTLFLLYFAINYPRFLLMISSVYISVENVNSAILLDSLPGATDTVALTLFP